MASRQLVLHDTTEFTYQREDMSAVGLISKGSVRKDAQGRPVSGAQLGPASR